MKKGKHTEEQNIGVLKQVEAGRTVKEVARELGVSEATIVAKIEAGQTSIDRDADALDSEFRSRRVKIMIISGLR